MPSSAPIATKLKLAHDELEVDFIDQEALTAICNSAQELLNLIERDINEGSAGLDTFRDMVWPAVNRDNINTIKPRLRLVPLERIGVAQGKGGGKVMLAYFVQASRVNDYNMWSPPMVLKVAKAPTAGSTHDGLKEEKQNADIVKDFITNKDRFALPFHFAEGLEAHQAYSVLWSRFTGNTRLLANTQGKYWLGLDDLRGLLKDECKIPGVTAEQVVREAIELLHPLHRRGLPEPSRLVMNVVRHYRRYLRGILDESLEWPSDSSHWTSGWKAVWGNQTQ